MNANIARNGRNMDSCSAINGSNALRRKETMLAAQLSGEEGRRRGEWHSCKKWLGIACGIGIARPRHSPRAIPARSSSRGA
uniref:Uncharacterized protein n=1 Tax=Arundo donax TaxID=35708 RepID=A0A0A8ZBA1_ARUDO